MKKKNCGKNVFELANFSHETKMNDTMKRMTQNKNAAIRIVI